MNNKIMGTDKVVLTNHQLKYEDIKSLKPKIVKKGGGGKVPTKSSDKKPRRRIDIRGFLLRKYNIIKAFFINVVNKVIHPSKKTKKLSKIELERTKKQRNRGILGIGQLLVVVSIAYSSTIILMGVDSLASKIALLPQAVFALIILTLAFSKLYK